ncbi:unnamed protein product [Owenia fusiformis]|uniref:CCR4-NOT transcription complex subunit 10 n=1 Tax=Owenia fusiformis TaxID=6347 RepID=A0A8J1UU66_OWEFU|nr:unnamed protein product [Owenia fusiformis]
MAEGHDDSANAEDIVVPSIPAITEQERENASISHAEFDKGQYDACLNTINKLMSTRSSDPRVVHNKVIVEYYRNGFKKTDEFRKNMAAVCQQAHIDIDNVSNIDDADQCIIYYNQAVMLFYLRQYKTALNIAEKLFQFVEPLDEYIGRRIVFLLVELHLCTRQPDKAMGVLTFAEKNLVGNGKGEKGDSDSTYKQNQIEQLKLRLSQYKARCYIMLKSMKSCKREVKYLMNAAGVTVPVIYIKANFECIRGNYRKAIKVLNSCGPSKNVLETGESVPVMYYNAMGLIHFNMKKHNLGAFYFKKAIQENETVTREVNKKEFGKSLSGRPVQCLTLSRHYELLYNMGIQLLHCGRPLAAFDCLIEVIQVFQVNPRLWLRLAECCVMVHKQSNDDDRRLEERQKVINGSVGSGVHRKLILGTGLHNKDKLSGESGVMPSATLEFAALCLRNALSLLPEDSSSTDSSTRVSSNEDSEQKGGGDIVLVDASPGNPMKPGEVANIRCSMLAQSAYVALCLKDYLMALSHAETLLKQSRLSGAHRYLGHMYVSEALAQLDCIADSISHLNPEAVTDVLTTFPEQKHIDPEKEKNGDQEHSESDGGALFPWAPKDVTKARAIMQYNLAVAHAMREEYEKASTNLSKSIAGIGTPLPAQTYFLRLYLDLIEGRRRIAQGIIKDHFGHVTPNRV